MANAGLQNPQRVRLDQRSVRAGCVLMTVQQRGYSGAADPKLWIYSYRRAGSAWVWTRRDSGEVKCADIRYWGGRGERC